MDLAQLTGRPEFSVELAGHVFHFSELPIGRQADLQAWLRQHVPHPLESIKEHLAGMPEAVAMQLAENARREALHWPPEIGTPEGAHALLGSLFGQIEALYQGLLVHQPDITRDEAGLVYSALKKMRDEDLVRKIYSVIFGTGDPGDEVVPSPKKGAGVVRGRNGR